MNLENESFETSFCARGHEVWWAELNERRVAFVRFTRGYDLEAGGPVLARPLRHCFRLHADICDSVQFTRPKRAFYDRTGQPASINRRRPTVAQNLD